MEISKLERRSYINPFFFNDCMLNEIVLYNKDGVITKTEHGWFGNENMFYIFEVPLIKTKRKVDFNHKGAFIIPNKKGYTWRKEHSLYLQVDDSNVKIIEITETKKTFGMLIHTYKIYKVDILGKVVYIEQIINVENTEQGKELNRWEAKLKEQGISIGTFSLKLLLEKYNLVAK